MIVMHIERAASGTIHGRGSRMLAARRAGVDHRQQPYA